MKAPMHRHGILKNRSSHENFLGLHNVVVGQSLGIDYRFNELQGPRRGVHESRDKFEESREIWDLGWSEDVALSFLPGLTSL